MNHLSDFVHCSFLKHTLFQNLSLFPSSGKLNSNPGSSLPGVGIQQNRDFLGLMKETEPVLKMLQAIA
jgi:hypothetical protein